MAMTAVMVEMALRRLQQQRKSGDPYGGDTNSNGNGGAHGHGRDDYNSKG
jgi:hypothetical protein